MPTTKAILLWRYSSLYFEVFCVRVCVSMKVQYCCQLSQKGNLNKNKFYNFDINSNNAIWSWSVQPVIAGLISP